MIFNFLDRIGGFFDRSFILAYWSPVFLTFGMLGAVQVLHVGLAPTIRLWEAQSVGHRMVAGVALLLVITILGYLLQAFTAVVVRTFEGYTWPSPVARWSAHWLREQARELDVGKNTGDTDASLARSSRYFLFPPKLEDVRPTLLGNVLTSAEHYPKAVYGLLSVLWWPRLFPLLPDSFREQIGAALMPMLSLLNLCCGCILVAFAGGGYLAAQDLRWWPWLLVFSLGLLLARVCYRSAVAQALGYGNLVRSAFDLHRGKILKEMGLFIPTNYEDERVLWKILNAWLFRFEPPYWYASRTGIPGWGVPPFRYDGKEAVTPASPPLSDAAEPVEVNVRVGWL